MKSSLKYCRRSMGIFMMMLCYATQAQSPSYLPKGLHKLSDEELSYVDLHLVGLPLYMDGKRVSYKLGPKMKADPAYTLDYYGNKKGEIKAVVIRASTAEERDIKSDPNSRPPDPTGWKNALPPEFKVKDMKGNEVDIVELEGKVVVLNFWYIGCKPCMLEIPELNELVEKYKSQDIVFLGLALDRASALSKFMAENEYDYNLIPRARPVAKKFGVQLYPSHFVIDKKGLVRLFRQGYGPGTIGQIDREIARRLRE